MTGTTNVSIDIFASASCANGKFSIQPFMRQYTAGVTDMNFTKPRVEALESRLAPATFTVTKLNDSGPGSLRQALADADNHAGPDSIVFHLSAPPLHAENIITLTTGELTSKGNVTITGPGAGKLVIDGNNNSRVFHFDDGNANTDSPATISGLSIVHGFAPVGGGIFSLESVTLKNVIVSGNVATVAEGGGVFLAGNATKAVIENSLVTGNSATAGGASGGGVCLANGPSSIAVSNTVVAGNTASWGAGIDLFGLTSVAISKTVITGNTAVVDGGGVYASLGASATGMTINGSTVTGNSARSGGGLLVKDLNTSPTSKIAISTTTITGNVSMNVGMNGGGGLFAAQGNTVVTGCTIRNNSAVNYGGGVEATKFNSLAISKSTISGNQTNTPVAGATAGGGGVFVLGSGLPTPQPVEISNSQFTENSSAAYGGGLLARNGLAVTVSGSTFSSNRTFGSGGGILTTGTGANKVDLTVTGGAFTDNFGGNAGGAIASGGDGVISITGSKLTGSVSAIEGGGIYANSSASVTIKNVVATGNFASDGGGLYIAFTPAFKISGGSFTGNSVTGWGGGIVAYASTGSILGVTISGNVATLKGGGVFQKGAGVVSLQIGKVSANSAPTGPDVSGVFAFV
jgi:hypothetical protein